MHDRNAKAAGRKPENAKDKGKIFKGGVNRFDDSEDDEDGPSKGLHVPGAETAGLINVKDRLAAAKKSTGECFGWGVETATAHPHLESPANDA